MAAASLKPSLVKRYDLSIHFPYTSSPMGYFGDDKRRICVDFISITHHFDNYKAEVSGKTLRLYMKLPKRFIDPQRLNSELANIGSDRDTIVSAQTETASMIYNQYRDEDNIWSSPQVVHLPFEVENEAYFKPIFSDGCDKLYSKLSVWLLVDHSLTRQSIKCIATYVSLQLVVNGPFEDLTRFKNS